ncbi:hypothetical protein [Rodentibacter pneumotropicus]|uniref:Uncharacterized protein n=1 Tax=Rodentibacter pneumotropicus TaxID=758 RepID=A0A3S4UQA8_9PAST|nr:hypothetical protein [Rodentibacter pneumotropicus]TGZ98715.1 hypothetical protein D3M72_10535 [Rodentibacter pneumotropicus]THA17191.1 hypothetical protein D3M82_01210 [Rodentibacter pneumotropicus]VEH67246.1 Uncharacterised protein [Rodentibacter pneumotropicus]
MPDTPLTHDKIMEIFDTKESDCDKVKSDIKALPDDNKLTNASAKARALAMADYACKYFEAVQQNARANMIIALIQQAASFYFADKQHDVAKQAQNRFDEIWNDQKDKSDKFFNHWYDNSRLIEIRMLNDASAREQAGYQVDYETAKNRAVTQARSEFSRARDKVQRESNIHCVGATRTALRQLQVAEAKAVVLATNQAIRFEEERKHQRESQYREEMYKWNAMFQGRIADSLRSLSTAQQAAAAASQIKPYEGWTHAVGQLSHIGRHLGTMNTAEFGLLNSHRVPAFANNLWG